MSESTQSSTQSMALFGPYRTIVADPPWAQKGGPLTGEFGEGFAVQGSRPSQDLRYPTMSVDQIASLPVGSLAAERCHLYLWTTNKYLPQAFEVVKAWGFRYSTTIVWSKALMGGGLGGTWRISTEFCLFAYRGLCDNRGVVRGTEFVNVPEHPGNERFPAVAEWKRPYDERGKPKHSAKPPEFFQEVMRVSHPAYLELFARERRHGWDAWGNEVESDVELAA